MRSIYNEAASEPDEKARKAIAHHARHSESDHRLTAMINLAESGITAWVAEFESKRRSERTLAGLARALREGKKLGRPKGSKDKAKRQRTGYLLRYANPTLKERYSKLRVGKKCRTFLIAFLLAVSVANNRTILVLAKAKGP